LNYKCSYSNEAHFKLRTLRGKGLPALSAHHFIKTSPRLLVGDNVASQKDKNSAASAPSKYDVRTTEDHILIHPSWAKAVDVVCDGKQRPFHCHGMTLPKNLGK
jgi:hypothetical protein